ncbi:MAG: hypothetical protein IMX02_09910 [Limnochordaceae bacterium]|uniref:DUF5320 domain-containing protein n=1 Tax=Carboxydichorda subterranea TaxID=3109565 RepID=A0ABZ1BZZ5_9FIRM|nr:hypothetical protein [Limnochorda sp. L945t]MBE3599076.1 hypothetical protein [Limnochordaceae bacterium]WRP17677.1 hypothetical protein U7230_01265 [Limnochorda sp. L945t]
MHGMHGMHVMPGAGQGWGAWSSPLGWGPRRMGWGCGGPRGTGFRRRFISRQERLEWLREYLRQLRLEAQAVEEAIRELGGETSSEQTPGSPAA